jgi:hypothetical protein
MQQIVRPLLIGGIAAGGLLLGTALPASASTVNSFAVGEFHAATETLVGHYGWKTACEGAGQYYADGGTGYECRHNPDRMTWDLWIYG